MELENIPYTPNSLTTSPIWTQENINALNNTKELLKIKEGSPISPAPDARDANYYATRPCAKIVENASEIVEKYILK